MSGKGREKVRQIISILMAFFMMIQLAGCAEPTEEKLDETEAFERQEVLWQGESFGEIQALTEGSPVYLVEYQEGVEGLPDLSGEDFNSVSFNYLGFYQEKIYLLATCSNSEWILKEDGEFMLSLSNERYYVSIYDLVAGEWDCREMTFDFPKLGGEVTSDGELLFYDQVLNQDTTDHYYAVYMDLSGTERTRLDLYPAMQEFGMELNPGVRVECVCHDDRGYLYVTDPKKPRVGVIDETGSLVNTMELSLERAEVISCSMKTGDGAVIFETKGIKGNDKVTTLFWYDDTKGDISILGDIGSGGESASRRYMSQYEEIYYATGSSLVRWNWRTGVREKVFNFSENGINSNFYGKYCVAASDGQLFLLDTSEGTVQLYVFSETEPDYEGAIRIADILSSQGDGFIKSCAAGFSRKNPLCHVGYELADHDRIMNEIISGEGPAILIVNREEMETLYEKGVLADLSDVLSEETQEQIFGCVLEAGRIDGKLIGLGDSASGWTLYASRDVWQKDTWSLEEFVDLAESREGELEALIVGQNPYYQTPFSTFNTIALMDLENSPFIDWEKGECYFDGTLFRRVLTLCMRYGEQMDSNYNYMTDQSAFEDAAVQKLKEGRALAYFGNGIGDFDMFSQEMAMFGDDFYSVGFPTGERSGAFCGINSFMVVNARAENIDKVYDFLRYCYDYDTQRTDSANVRKDVMRAFVGYSTWDESWSYSVGGGTYILLESKPDGDSWLEEYLECMDGCVPRPDKSWDVIRMIQEEVNYYFDGERDMEQTIDVLQRRVQLYLDEHNL